MEAVYFVQSLKSYREMWPRKLVPDHVWIEFLAMHSAVCLALHRQFPIRPLSEAGESYRVCHSPRYKIKDRSKKIFSNKVLYLYVCIPQKWFNELCWENQPVAQQKPKQYNELDQHSTWDYYCDRWKTGCKSTSCKRTLIKVPAGEPIKPPILEKKIFQCKCVW